MREIIPRNSTEVGVEESPKSGDSSTLILTALMAAAGVVYVLRSDVSSQGEWSKRYGGKR